MNAPIIRSQNLVFEYPGLRALDDVSFEIPAGSITALVGPNGAGKTTLMRCIAGLEQPLTGAITVDGVDVLANPREAHRHIGYLSDFFGLYDALTVRQCLTFVAAAQGIARHDVGERIALAASQLGLTDRLDQRAGDLSRGLRQRVAIAQAIIHTPRVLMLDEPASGLDPESRHALSALLVSLRERGMTLLVSSHILAELSEYSTHMLILRAGRIADQSAIGSAHPSALLLRVTMAREVPDLATRLAGYPDIRVNAGDTRSALIECGLDATGQHDLLARMINDGLPVQAFAAEGVDLQRVYLDSLHKPAGEAHP
jgi:ABC-2 type transport system ATP-binding protein